MQRPYHNPRPFHLQFTEAFAEKMCNFETQERTDVFNGQLVLEFCWFGHEKLHRCQGNRHSEHASRLLNAQHQWSFRGPTDTNTAPLYQLLTRIYTLN
jgi:hypothetical protein